MKDKKLEKKLDQIDETLQSIESKVKFLKFAQSLKNQDMEKK